MSNPKSWHKFVLAVESGKLSGNSGLSRFAARYKVASSLKAIEFDKLNVKTAEAYFLAFKLSLAYSSLESLENCEILNTKHIRVENSEIASELRKKENIHLLNFLLSETTSKKLRMRLSEFSSGECNDLRIIAESIRHLTFHGILTANGSGIAKSARLQKLLAKLTDEVFIQINLEFSNWLEDSLT
ncbi:hypothetical protein GM50_9665 [freshwater metagenome]|uniref:Uncharacterized protein n=1 Tax=freshwater metagenome TaxID=449393 RepID=A0A094SI78_9ZZZZ